MPNDKLFRRIFLNNSKDIQRAFNRPHGNTDVMLSMESRLLHCRGGYEVGNIRLNTIVFDPG